MAELSQLPLTLESQHVFSRGRYSHRLIMGDLKFNNLCSLQAIIPKILWVTLWAVRVRYPNRKLIAPPPQKKIVEESEVSEIGHALPCMAR